MRRARSWFPVLVLALFACQTNPDSTPTPADSNIMQQALELAHKTLIVDTHVDVPYRMESLEEDISQRTERGDFDYVRARQGGLDAPFMSIYVAAEHQGEGARAIADRLIDMVESFEQRWPDKFRVARSVADVEQAFRQGLIALPMGMENGAPIEGDLGNLRHFHQRGIRYITLTHSKVNHICDSSYDSERKWHGLSPFGRELIQEMNRVGVMVDISHVSDETFDQVLELSRAPVIASHSSCRSFTPGWERNLSDDMIRRLGDKGGVIQIAWGSSFISDRYRLQAQAVQEAVDSYLKANSIEANSEEGRKYAADYRREHPVEFATVSDVVDHIDHVVELAGVDHVGFGSDFDGVGDSLPIGLKDVSQYPNLIAEMLRRNYSPQDIQKICSGNLLRVWKEVERLAASSQ